MPLITYVDTSLVSYLTGRLSSDEVVAEYQQASRNWWRNAPGRFEIFVSELVLKEASKGNRDAARLRLKALEGVARLDVTKDTGKLADALLDARAVPSGEKSDATHIAISVTCGVDFLLSWDFKHIVNPNVLPKIEQVCRQMGYAELPVICTPNEAAAQMTKEIPNNPIIAEVRAARTEYSSQFKDVTEMIEDLRVAQARSGREYFSFRKRRAGGSNSSTASRAKKARG